jgi:hypothetical protein
MKSMYAESNEWIDELMNTFPKDVKCPVCERGAFEVSISGAVVNGVCGVCRTSVPYRFYDMIYPFLDNLKK